MELLTSMQGSQTSLLVSFVLTAEDQKSWRGGERDSVFSSPGLCGETRPCLYLCSQFLGKMAPNFTILIKNNIHYPKFKFSK